MGATNAFDQERIRLENILAHLVSATERMACALTRTMNKARTEYEANTAREILAALNDVDQARRTLAHFHPERLERKDNEQKRS